MRPEVNSNWFEISLRDKISLRCEVMRDKCALMATYSYQIEMCSLRLIYIIRMKIQAKINEAVK